MGASEPEVIQRVVGRVREIARRRLLRISCARATESDMVRTWRAFWLLPALSGFSPDRAAHWLHVGRPKANLSNQCFVGPIW